MTTDNQSGGTSVAPMIWLSVRTIANWSYPISDWINIGKITWGCTIEGQTSNRNTGNRRNPSRVFPGSVAGFGRLQMGLAGFLRDQSILSLPDGGKIVDGSQSLYPWIRLHLAASSYIIWKM